MANSSRLRRICSRTSGLSMESASSVRTKPGGSENGLGIMSVITAFWSTSPLRYERYRTIAIHGTADPNTIIVEQEVEGTSSTTGPFVLPNIMALKARHGEIAHVRDYANLLAVREAIGHPVQ